MGGPPNLVAMNTAALTPSLAPTSTVPAAPARLAERPFRIAAGAVLCLRHARGLQVQVIEGRLWVTAEGDAEDHVVGPGGTLPLGRARAVVMENIGRDAALLRLVRG